LTEAMEVLGEYGNNYLFILARHQLLSLIPQLCILCTWLSVWRMHSVTHVLYFLELSFESVVMICFVVIYVCVFYVTKFSFVLQ